MIAQGLTGVVLAGGRSSRLGRDKALLRLPDGTGVDLLARSVGLLEKVCGRAVVIGREHSGYVCFSDRVPGFGPAGGIATALEVTGTACLTLSCDLPFMRVAVLEQLLAEHAARPPGVLSTAYRQKGTGRIEALVAVYEAEALPFFQACLREGQLKISLALPRQRQHFLDYSTEEALPFFNINSPADLEAARRMLRACGPEPE